jgi:hypothetical protein
LWTTSIGSIQVSTTSFADIANCVENISATLLIQVSAFAAADRISIQPTASSLRSRIAAYSRVISLVTSLTWSATILLGNILRQIYHLDPLESMQIVFGI